MISFIPSEKSSPISSRLLPPSTKTSLQFCLISPNACELSLIGHFLEESPFYEDFLSLSFYQKPSLFTGILKYITIDTPFSPLQFFPNI